MSATNPTYLLSIVQSDREELGREIGDAVRDAAAEVMGSSGMGLVGVYVHKLKVLGQGNQFGTFVAPPNPLEDRKAPGGDDATSRLFADRASDRYETHTWEPTGTFGTLFGSNDLGNWVEEAARRAGRT